MADFLFDNGKNKIVGLSKSQIDSDFAAVDENYTNLNKTVNDSTEIIDNLFLIEAQEINGVTVSVSDDGTITLNGTATQNTFIYINSESLKAGTYTARMYIISGETSSNAMPSMRYSTELNNVGTRWVNRSSATATKTFDAANYIFVYFTTDTVFTSYSIRFLIKEGTTAGDYVKPEVSAVDKITRRFIESLQGFPKFVVPSTSIAVVGHEYNIYFDNIINGMDFERFTVKVTLSSAIESAKCFEKFFRIEPTSNDIGNKTVTLSIYEKNGFVLIDSVSITLKIISDDSVSGKKVMFIGDSLTAAGVYAAEIQYLMSNGGIVSVGTRETTCQIDGVSYTVKHEGRGGWAAYDYTRSRSTWATGIENPFYDEENQKFSFEYYMNTTGVSKPDIVCIGLGTNGNINGLTDVLEMVNSVHEYDANLPVIVALITPPAFQNGCGYNNGLQNAAEMKDRFLQCCANYIENYDNGTNTDVAELYFQFDREHDYNTTMIQVSARNPQTMTVQSNNVHPSPYGYLHFADGYFNRLLYWLTK